MLLVVGWDGACFELADRFRGEGRMPALDGLLDRGSAFRVRSTVPAVTFPAWTSFLTGAHPDHHGVTDFTMPLAGSYGVRFVNSTHRRLPTILAAMASAGLRVGAYGMPATYPPEGRCVFEVCGFDTPLGASGSDAAAHPPGLAASIRRRFGRLGIEGIAQSEIDAGWHERARRQLPGDVRLRTRIVRELAREHALDVLVVHFMEPDTAAHHFWQFHDAGSPRRREGPAAALAEVYAALDASLAELLEAAGPGARVMLLSDHGSAGASDRVLFWNRWLAGRGLLAFRETASEPVAAKLKRGALAMVPGRWQARAFAAAGSLAARVESGARFAGIDWSRTAVFSDEVPYFPSLRFNVAGREPRGTVAPADVDALAARTTGELLAMRDPFDGGAVVERVRRREELFDGPFASRYPDLVLELRRPGGYAYCAGSSRGGLEREWMRRLRGDEASGAKGRATSGVHSDHGMAVLAGPAVAGPAARDGGPRAAGDDSRAALPECSLADLGVTALAMAGLAPSAAMQGRALVGFAGLAPGPSGERGREERDYGEDEEREVAERLRALGYLP